MRSLFITICLSILSVTAQAQYLSIQGVLRDASNNAVADGNYNMTFSLYSDTTAAALWTETQTSVPVQNGVYSAQLGTVTSLANVTFSASTYLGVKIGGNLLSPYIVLSAAPYAMAVRGSANAINGNGNVGIGTLSPNEKLDVRGGNLRVSFGNLLLTSAKLGIGTASPSAEIDVVGSIKASSNITALNAITPGGARLNSNGDVVAGTSGSFKWGAMVAPLANSNMRFITGTVDSNGTVRNSTNDFSVTKLGTGLYRVVINYNPTYLMSVQVIPFHTWGPGRDFRFIPQINKLTPDAGNNKYEIDVKISNSDGSTLWDQSFFFTAIVGPY